MIIHRRFFTEIDRKEITNEIIPTINKNRLNHWLITIELANSGQNGRKSRVDSPRVILEPIDPKIIIDESENTAEIICKIAKLGFSQTSGPNLIRPKK